MISKIKRTLGFLHRHPLASENLFTAYRNFFLWQLKTAFNHKLIVNHFIGNVRFYAKRGLTGVTGNIYTGLHEFEDMGFLLHFLRPEDTFFDVGANVGSYTLLASGYVGAKTLSFEPVPETFAILKKNIVLNNLSEKVTLHNKAVGSEKGHVKFTASLDTVNHVVAIGETDTQTIEVEVVTLDTFLDQQPILFKIDVEGFESEAINGGKEILASETAKAIIIELNGSGERYGYQEENIHEHLKEIGYLPYQYDPFSRSLTEITHFGSHNTIYIKDIEFVRERCQTAGKVSALGLEF